VHRNHPDTDATRKQLQSSAVSSALLCALRG
jgi:hypothetical protein